MSEAISCNVRGAVDYAMCFDLRILHLSESLFNFTLFFVCFENCYNVLCMICVKGMAYVYVKHCN